MQLPGLGPVRDSCGTNNLDGGRGPRKLGQPLVLEQNDHPKAPLVGVVPLSQRVGGKGNVSVLHCGTNHFLYQNFTSLAQVDMNRDNTMWKQQNGMSSNLEKILSCMRKLKGHWMCSPRVSSKFTFVSFVMHLLSLKAAWKI